MWIEWNQVGKVQLAGELAAVKRELSYVKSAQTSRATQIYNNERQPGVSRQNDDAERKQEPHWSFTELCTIKQGASAILSH